MSEIVKKLHLVERNELGHFHKNESYFYPQMKKLITAQDAPFWNHWLLGKMRRAIMDKIFDVFTLLTDLDTLGKK